MPTAWLPCPGNTNATAIQPQLCFQPTRGLATAPAPRQGFVHSCDRGEHGDASLCLCKHSGADPCRPSLVIEQNRRYREGPTPACRRQARFALADVAVMRISRASPDPGRRLNGRSLERGKGRCAAQVSHVPAAGVSALSGLWAFLRDRDTPRRGPKGALRRVVRRSERLTACHSTSMFSWLARISHKRKSTPSPRNM